MKTLGWFFTIIGINIALSYFALKSMSSEPANFSLAFTIILGHAIFNLYVICMAAKQFARKYG